MIHSSPNSLINTTSRYSLSSWPLSNILEVQRKGQSIHVVVCVMVSDTIKHDVIPAHMEDDHVEAEGVGDEWVGAVCVGNDYVRDKQLTV